MPSEQNKLSQINIRARHEQRALIDKAASRLNKTRSDFMLETACHEAENVLLDQRLFLTDEATMSAFHALLEAPLSHNDALLQLLKQKSPWEK